MKKMFIKGAIFLILLFIPLCYLNLRYKNTNYYLQLNGLGKFRNVPNEIEVLNLGNSHEQAGIIYDDTKFKGYNMALASQPFEYDYQVLDFYHEHLANGAIVIIPISYFDWYYNYEEIFMSEISAYNERYYSILDKDHIMNYKIQKDILYNRFPLLTAGKSMTYIFDDINWTNEAVNNNIVNNINETAEYKYKSWTEEVMASKTAEKERVKSKNIRYLKKTINYCYKQGYKPVLVTLPMTNQLTKKFSQEFKNDYYACIEEVLAEYPQLRYFDYSTNQIFSGNLQFFSDSDHLNADGALAFSEMFFEELRREKILPN